jgi:protein involved in polysaccharide export with SLBB domain
LATAVATAQVPTPLPYNGLSANGHAGVVGSNLGAPPPGVSSPIPAMLNGFVADATYKLRVGDTISYQIMEDRIWNSLDAPKPLVVTDSGEVDVPYIGRVMAVNKTCKELADDIQAALEKDYYNKATVALSLNLANRLIGRVYIWGQVRGQGALDLQMNEDLTVGEAILKAGGFADFANKTKVKLVRGSVDKKGEKQTFDLDMDEILEKGKIEKDVVLQPGDLIIVPSRLVNF